MHRMSGTHTMVKFELRGAPLIGDLCRSANYYDLL